MSHIKDPLPINRASFSPENTMQEFVAAWQRDFEDDRVWYCLHEGDYSGLLHARAVLIGPSWQVTVFPNPESSWGLDLLPSGDDLVDAMYDGEVALGIIVDILGRGNAVVDRQVAA